jgi:hypothetical protein
MTAALTFAILDRLVRRGRGARLGRTSLRRINQFRMSAPTLGRLFDGDRDIIRVEHDLEAIRTRFEQNPAWPFSGAVGERR